MYISINDLRNLAFSLSGQVYKIMQDYQNRNCKSEDEAISQCMIQMACDKMMSVVSLLDNGFFMNVEGKQTKLDSTFSPLSICRSLYELVLIHHALFVNPENDEIKKILINIWKIKGLWSRCKYDVTPQYERQKQKELEEIEELKNKIRNSPLYQEISIEQLERAFVSDKTGYFTLVKNEDKYNLTTISFGDKALFDKVLGDIDGIRKLGNDMTYNYLSSASHPTYLLVFQFGLQCQMELDKRWFSLNCAIIFVHCMINNHNRLYSK